jgi:hypothetical protein
MPRKIVSFAGIFVRMGLHGTGAFDRSDTHDELSPTSLKVKETFGTEGEYAEVWPIQKSGVGPTPSTQALDHRATAQSLTRLPVSQKIDLVIAPSTNVTSGPFDQLHVVSFVAKSLPDNRRCCGFGLLFDPKSRIRKLPLAPVGAWLLADKGSPRLGVDDKRTPNPKAAYRRRGPFTPRIEGIVTDKTECSGRPG